MIKFRRQLGWLLCLLGVTAVYLNATRILTPPRMLSTQLSSEAASELANLNYFGPTNSWNGLLFGDRTRWASMDAYIGLRDEYDRQQNYGLLDHHGDAHYMGRFSSLAASAFGDWRAYQVKMHGKRLGRLLGDEIGLDELRRNRSPLLLVGVVAAAYMGRMFRYRITDDLTFETRTEMSGGSYRGQYVGWRSPAFSASAGATYGSGGSSLVVQKQITDDVSLNYTPNTDHSIGLLYSKGF